LFAPTKNVYSKQTFLDGLNKLIRRLKLKDFFSLKKSNKTDAPSPFQGLSTWNPPILMASTQNTIENLVTVTNSVLESQSLDSWGNIKLFQKSNLPGPQKTALNSLRHNPDIIIKPSDKGGSIVIMDKTQYETECMRQLNDKKYYIEINQPIFSNNIPHLNLVLNNLNKSKYINNKQLDYLLAREDSRPRLFYILPKVHKDLNSWPSPSMPPGRPIVSDCSSESYHISEYIDSFLTPLANRHPSFIKDTYDFLQKTTNKPIPPGCFLVTGDITSLYTNMDLDRTLATVQRIFKTYPDPARPDLYLLKLFKNYLKQ
jgi:hypothetical protein